MGNRPPKSKWLDELAPQATWGEGARAAFQSRLAQVEYYLPRAACKSADDVEYVHQLRVATRRATAALAVFRDAAREKPRRWLKRKLRQIRRAAGDARELDVLLLRLENGALPLADDKRGEVTAEIVRRRRRAQRPLEDLFQRLPAARLNRRAARLPADDGVAAGQGAFAAGARVQLGRLVAAFFDRADGDLDHPVELHAFRIAGKRLRYGIELLAAAFEPSLREEIYPQIEELQEILGQLNDHVSARERFEGWRRRRRWGAWRDVLDAWVDHEQRALVASSEAFRGWWTSERRQQLGGHFDRLLAEPSACDGDAESAPAATLAAGAP